MGQELWKLPRNASAVRRGLARLVAPLALGALLLSCSRDTRRAEDCIILRLHGSTTIGAMAAPQLAKAYLRWLGADSVAQVAGAAPSESYAIGRTGGRADTIAIRLNGSRSGIADLAAGACDITMSSVRVDSADCAHMSRLGDMQSPACEHVIGYDGVVVIVNPMNPLDYMSLRDVRGVFTGSVWHWSALYGKGTDSIQVFCQNGLSGTYWYFAREVLKQKALASRAILLADGQSVAAAVASDPRAVGVVSLTATGGNRLVSISEDGVAAFLPSKFSIAAKDYPLARAVYLYTPEKSDNGHIKAFVEFAQGVMGRAIIERSGFASDTVRVGAPVPIADAPVEYRRATTGAMRLSTTFRFEPNGRRMDRDSRDALQQLVRYIEREELGRYEIRLLGYSDARETPEEAQAVAARLAQTAATTLRAALNVKTTVVAIGDGLPIASNATPEGRLRNRRVEVWLNCGRVGSSSATR